MYKLQYFILFLIFFYLKSNSQQGNYKFNNFGNKSILLSGNVTGSVEDLGVTYYNPSRLVFLENTSFAFNAKAFQINSIKLSNIDGEASKVRNTDFDGVPGMAGGTFKLFNERFAYSFISKSRLNIDLNYSTTTPQSKIMESFIDLTAYKATINLRTKINDDWFGLTWAKQLNEKISLGVSLFGSIYTYDGQSDLNYTIQYEDNSTAFMQYITGFSQDSYGLLIKIGGNYHFQKLDVGININLPYLEVYKKAHFNYNYVIAGIGNEIDQFYDYDLTNLSSTRKEPLGISIGSGVPIGKSKLHFNIDYISGLSNYQRIEIPDIDTGKDQLTSVFFEEKRKDVFNFGAGAELYLNEKFTTIVGLSTDFSAFGSNANIFDLSSRDPKDVNVGEDFFHWSIGVDWNLKWASFVLGTTYTSGSSTFQNPLNISKSGINFNDTATSKIDYNRWQFVIGIEIPLLDSFSEKIK